MQIIVIGAGKVGVSLAAELIKLDHDIVIVDSDPELMRSAEDLDCVKVTGVPIDNDVLRDAGIETADIVCAVTQNDNINIMASQIARLVFGVKRVYTRIYNPASSTVFNELGLDSISSTQLTVQAFLRSIEHESSEDRHFVYGTRLIYTRTEPDPVLIGQDITRLTSDAGNPIIGVTRQNRLLLSRPGLRIQEGDEIVQVEVE